MWTELSRLGGGATVLAAAFFLGACGSPPEPAPRGDAGATPPGAPPALSIRKGFSLAEHRGEAFGEAAHPRCNAPLPSGPQLRMVMEEPMSGVEVEVEGDGFTLLVSQGSSAWCGRAEAGRVVVGRGAWGKGDYQIHVGTTEVGAKRPFSLRVREITR